MLDVHDVWAWVVIVGNGLAGLWALVASKWPAFRHAALWWVTVAVELAVFVQVILGVWLVAAEDIPAPDFHMFYGFLTIIAVGILYSYRHQMRHRLYQLYGLGGLFIMGLGLRALVIRT
ncbi:MAG TPA: hypothetical protein VF045_05455 [Acidimicrobiales bacterium]